MAQNLQCPTCTLVNEPGAEACTACRTRLNGSTPRRNFGASSPNTIPWFYTNDDDLCPLLSDLDLPEVIINHQYCLCIFVAVCFIVGTFILIFSFEGITVMEYGLRHNKITGSVGDKVYTTGRHCISPAYKFVKFPRNQIFIEFSDHIAPDVQSSIWGRTGGDKNDENSGGQPLTLSCSMNVKLPKESISKIYRKYTANFLPFFYQYIRVVVSEQMQKYHPTMFWKDRSRIGIEMASAVHTALYSEAGAILINFQMLDIVFLESYEDTIVNIQLAVQKKTTLEYQYQVESVVKETDILESQANATIAVIDANAQAESSIIINKATNEGFFVVESQKAKSYKTFEQGLELTDEKAQLLKYIQIRNIRDHKAQNSVIGFPSPLSNINLPKKNDLDLRFSRTSEVKRTQ